MQNSEEIKKFEEKLVNRIVISPNGIAVLDKLTEPEKHTEDIQEIITKVPSWIISWGITLIFIAVFIIVAITMVVPYPEMVKSTIKIQSSSIQTLVNANEAGFIKRVFVKKDNFVKAGQPLIEIKKHIDQTTYILKSPMDGRVGFSAVIQNGAVAEKNQDMFTIHPLKENYFGIMRISKNEISKIKVGQDVLIKLIDDSSVMGSLIYGKVDFVTDEPVSNQFIVKVAFKDSLDYRKLNIKSWMEFEGRIATKKSNLFFKIFEGIINGYKRI